MAKKLARLGIKRDNDRMYYIKDGAVWSVPRKKPGKTTKGKKQKVAQFAAKGSLDYSKQIYFLDKAGDVAAAPRPSRKKKTKR